MKPTPLWKLKRELRRLLLQIVSWPAYFIEYVFATPIYDLAHRGKIRRLEGNVGITRRIAIYVIYPSDGLLESHLIALRYMVSKGVAPLVVSNLPLSDMERTALRPVTWRCLERQNVGYDFGGYRDGVLELAEQRTHLDRLYFLNDSTWFPLPDSDDWFDDVEQLDVDLCGAASNWGIARFNYSELDDAVWSYDSGHRKFHYCSFALACSGRLARDRQFLRFWEHLRMSGTKKRVVRRGEVGFTQWALRNGYSHASTLNVASVNQLLASLDDDRTWELARNLIIPEDKRLLALKKQVLADPTTDRTRLEKLIMLAISRQGISYAGIDLICSEAGFPFVKKSPLWLDEEASAVLVAFLQAREDCRTFHDEAAALRRLRLKPQKASAGEHRMST
ncbi:rhamnan synthesis F family protein [Nitratireductor sp. XY-223]|uniref:rhamnan synthesis F family protein n=1 Tax=Nitratireductor sp. XY-223 TaxID=2561926 RepID=UPI0010AAF78F|nr:rhamnan synthesis F family protein [Nitratireductor sp. XY-223]